MREAYSLLLDCIHYVKVMQLSRNKTIERVCEERTDQRQIRNTFWFLFSLEKTYCLQAEMVPVSFPTFDIKLPPAFPLTSIMGPDSK